jgi:hypothetical protein
MWTMEGRVAPLDPEHFENVETLSAEGKVVSLQAQCRRCHQRWMNSTYPIASEGWHPVRD